MLKELEDQRVLFGQPAHVRLGFDEATVQGGGEVAGVEAQDVLGNEEGALVGAGADFDGDNGAGECVPAANEVSVGGKKDVEKARYSGGCL